jgi:hypothetical protein
MTILGFPSAVWACLGTVVPITFACTAITLGETCATALLDFIFCRACSCSLYKQSTRTPSATLASTGRERSGKTLGSSAMIAASSRWPPASIYGGSQSLMDLHGTKCQEKLCLEAFSRLHTSKHTRHAASSERIPAASRSFLAPPHPRSPWRRATLEQAQTPSRARLGDSNTNHNANLLA